MYRLVESIWYQCHHAQLFDRVTPAATAATMRRTRNPADDSSSQLDLLSLPLPGAMGESASGLLSAGASVGSARERELPGKAEPRKAGASSGEERRGGSTAEDCGENDSKSVSYDDDSSDWSDGEGTEDDTHDDSGREVEAVGVENEPFIFPQYRYSAPVQGQHDVDVRVRRAQLRAEEVCSAASYMLPVCAFLKAVPTHPPPAPHHVLWYHHLRLLPARVRLVPCLTQGSAMQSAVTNGRWTRCGIG